MNWSLRLGKFFGIALYIHWTFALLLVAVFWSAGGFQSGGASIRDAMELVGFVVSVFVCVTLHEYGHALAARYFGIRTRDVTILPFGGLARIEIKKYRAIEEFVIAVAGPAVNVAIVGVLAVAVIGIYGVKTLMGMTFQAGFLQKLCIANITLVVFNMIPAFPMDGGRVLRSILASVFGLLTGTLVAARVGQGLAVLFISVAFSPIGSPMLAFIGVFVFLGAQAELRGVRARAAFESVRVGDVMTTSYGVLLPEDPVGAAVEAVRSGTQAVVPVVEAGVLVGVVGPRELQAAVERGEMNMPVRAVIRGRFPTVVEGSTGSEAVDKMQESQLAALPVMRGEQMVGLVTFEAIQSVASAARKG